MVVMIHDHLYELPQIAVYSSAYVQKKSPAIACGTVVMLNQFAFIIHYIISFKTAAIFRTNNIDHFTYFRTASKRSDNSLFSERDTGTGSSASCNSNLYPCALPSTCCTLSRFTI